MLTLSVENIQFLTRDVHLAAHENDFKNETSAYYDPGTGKSYACSDVVSAPIMELSEPAEVLDEGADLGGSEETGTVAEAEAEEADGISEEGPGTDGGEDAGMDGGEDGGLDF